MIPAHNDRCLEADRRLEPCTIIIFGASGDLTARKVIPSLYRLYLQKEFASSFTIIGTGRSVMDADDFRAHLKEKIGPEDEAAWQRFADNLFYQAVSYNEPAAYRTLANEIVKLEAKRQDGANRMFYLAVPPTLYPVIAGRLGEAGLAAEDRGWSRIVVEKPFGRDLQGAMALDEVMHRHFAEHQIFRIDHYLAKETVQNILMLRFANAIFEPVWNRGFVDYVGIMAAEQLGVEHRAGYYEQSGVIRDMFQNHMLQLLALTAMEPPSVFEAARVQDEKVKVFRSLKPFFENRPEENLMLGQYGAGETNGGRVCAYRDEPGVARDSLTPTFAVMRLFVDNWRWRGIPFYLVSGKRLQRKTTKIVVQFKEVPHSMFRNVMGEAIHANRLTLGIYPEEEIKLTFQAKKTGPKVCVQTVNMDFRYREAGNTPDAYARVLADCIQGDHMLFWRRDGVEQTWSFLDPILADCEQCSNRAGLLRIYPAGGWGPVEAAKWMGKFIEDDPQ